MPIKQIDIKENWRRILDAKNNSGWIHRSQLKSANSIIPLENKILFKKPTNLSRPIANINKGKLLILEKCLNSWCKVKTERFTGWIDSKNLWGK